MNAPLFLLGIHSVSDHSFMGGERAAAISSCPPIRMTSLPLRIPVTGHTVYHTYRNSPRHPVATKHEGRRFSLSPATNIRTYLSSRPFPWTAYRRHFLQPVPPEQTPLQHQSRDVGQQDPETLGGARQGHRRLPLLLRHVPPDQEEDVDVHRSPQEPRTQRRSEEQGCVRVEQVGVPDVGEEREVDQLEEGGEVQQGQGGAAERAGRAAEEDPRLVLRGGRGGEER